jgi:hypothetical protein
MGASPFFTRVVSWRDRGAFAVSAHYTKVIAGGYIDHQTIGDA